MKLNETDPTSDTNPRNYVGYPKVDTQTGKLITKGGKEAADGADTVNDKEFHDKDGDPDKSVPQPGINMAAESTSDRIRAAVKALNEKTPKEEAKPLQETKANPALANELLGLGLVNNAKISHGLKEENPMRKAMEIFYTSDKTNPPADKKLEDEQVKNTHKIVEKANPKKSINTYKNPEPKVNKKPLIW